MDEVSREIGEIIRQYEDLRHQMERLAKEKGFLDPEVLAISQALDSLFNDYHWLLKRKGEKINHKKR